MHIELSMWKNSGQFFDWKGHSIFVQDTASPNKPVLLLIHGFPTASYDFHLLWPALAETHRAILVQKLLLGPLGFVSTRLMKKRKTGSQFTQCLFGRIKQ